MLKTFTGHNDSVNSVTFSPDGKTLLTASRDNTARLWNLDGKEIRTLQHLGSVIDAQFSPDGQIIATGNSDHTIRLWNSNGEEIETLAGHRDRVLKIRFSPDGKTLASASTDKTARLWSLDLDLLLAKGCGILNHYLLSHPNDLETLTVCQTPNSKILAADAWARLAEAEASAGNLDEAMLFFQKAQAWNPTWKQNASIQEDKLKDLYAKYQKVATLQQAIGESIADKRYSDAVAQLTNIDQIDPDAARKSGPWNKVCWNGSLEGQASVVLSVCEKGVTLTDGNYKMRDSRGLARSLVGDFQGAIEDFQFFISVNTNSQSSLDSLQEVNARRRWVQALKAGKNPFTPEVLEELRGES